MNRPRLSAVLATMLTPWAMSLLATAALGGLPHKALAVEPHPEQARDGMVEAHNAVRARIQPTLPPLSWSDDAAEKAQAWAEHLARQDCRMRHNRDLEDFGQNLFWAGPKRTVKTTRNVTTGEVVERKVEITPQDVNAEAVVESWASEARWYDVESDQCRAPEGKSCGHYTQIVWRETTGVGCGMAVCDSDGQVWVCDYTPPGNVIGERPY